MSITFCGNGFVVSNNDRNHFLKNKGNFYEEDIFCQGALSGFFKDIIFQTTYKLNENGLNKVLIYDPIKRNTRLLNSNEVDTFKSKYLSKFKLIERSPEIFSFNIPLPEIHYFLENSQMKHEDMYNISIGRYKSQTYKNIENYTLRLDPKSRRNFDLIYQKEFLSVYNLAESYKEYLRIMMDIEPSEINTNNLIKPYYLLDQNEIKEILKIEDSINDKRHKESIREYEEAMDEQYGKWFDSEIDDMNRQAFENDPDNYWNID